MLSNFFVVVSKQFQMAQVGLELSMSLTTDSLEFTCHMLKLQACILLGSDCVCVRVYIYM